MLLFTSQIEIEHQNLLLLNTSEMESTKPRFAVKSESVLITGFVMISATKYLQITGREISLILL
jgi:sulfur transfer protein SufE